MSWGTLALDDFKKDYKTIQKVEKTKITMVNGLF